MWNGGDRKRSYRGLIPRELFLENRDCAERFFWQRTVLHTAVLRL